MDTCLSSDSKSTVTVACFAESCKYVFTVPWGVHCKYTTKDSAIHQVTVKVRKHVRKAFSLELHPDSPRNRLTTKDRQLWELEQLQKSCKSKVEFEQWDRSILATCCNHHPRNLSSDWKVTVHTSFQDTGGDDGSSDEQEPFLYVPNSTKHWPPWHRALASKEKRKSNKRRRKTIQQPIPIQCLLATAAVRGYKRFCASMGTAETSESSNATIKRNAKWAQLATATTKAYIAVARTEARITARRGNSRVLHSPLNNNLKQEVERIVAAAKLPSDVHITLEDIIGSDSDGSAPS